MVVFRPYTLLALKQILSIDPQFRVLIDMGDWVQAAGMMPMLKREFPTAYFSSDWKNWNQHMVNEARKLQIPTFVNVLGAEDTAENLARAVEMGFDYIQTDHPRRLLEILERRTSKKPSVRRNQKGKLCRYEQVFSASGSWGGCTPAFCAGIAGLN